MSAFEKLEQARKCFEKLKQERESLRHRISVSEISEAVKVDRKYFYGRINSSNSALIAKWVGLKSELDQFNLSLKMVEESVSPLDEARQSRDNALRENYVFRERAVQAEQREAMLKRVLGEANRKYDELKVEYSNLEARAYSRQALNSNVVVLHQKPIVISPDSIRKGVDSLSLKIAWVESVKLLESFLSQGKIKRLYITVGVPASGKSTWSKGATASVQSVIFDACNLTSCDRYELLELACRYKAEVIAVLFIVSERVVFERNEKRAGNDKVPSEKMKSMIDSIEYPSPLSGDEKFSKIIVIRQ
ncbi:TPA: AAA family ATPase [Pseudomonas aeruginosa]|nr:AAA family ATPase [Pseudomonas aeruginosa]